MSIFGDSNAQVYDALRARRAQRDVRGEQLRPIRAVDAVVSELEDMNVAGRKRVPEEYDRHLRWLLGMLPDDLAERYSEELRPRISIGHLMDRLFEVQDHLLTRRTGAPPDDFADGTPNDGHCGPAC